MMHRVAYLLGEARREAHHVDESPLHHSHPLRLSDGLDYHRAATPRGRRARRGRLRGRRTLRLRLRRSHPQSLRLRNRLLLGLTLIFELLGLEVKVGRWRRGCCGSAMRRGGSGVSVRVVWWCGGAEAWWCGMVWESRGGKEGRGAESRESGTGVLGAGTAT